MSQRCRLLTRHCDAAQSLLYVADITTGGNAHYYRKYRVYNNGYKSQPRAQGYRLGHETAQEYLARHNMR